MKERKEEITHKETITKWEAIDGTLFDDKEECRKYERSALAMLRGKVKQYAVNEPIDAWTLMGGCDDNQVVGYKLPTENAADTFIQFLFTECPWYLAEFSENKKIEVEKTIRKAQKEDDLILMGINCDGDYYFINTRQTIINTLLDLEKSKD